MGTHSIHHVTAVTAHIDENLAYYTQTLGLRLVKRSVNQDDVRAYHLFYADAVGTPGTDMTFFDWPMMRSNMPGLASIALTRFRIPGDSFEYWMTRLSEANSGPFEMEDDFGRKVIRFADPEGQRLELVDDQGLKYEAVPWDKHVPAEHAIRGILGVDLASARPEATAKVLTDILEYEQHPDIAVFSTRDGAGEVRIVEGTGMARLGAGGVHHVAFRVEDDDELVRMMEKIEASGLHTSGYVDRFYFHSIYFREPGGILFELATNGPGFASDEDMATLGDHLALPPFLEPDRESIEANLKPLLKA